MTAADATPPTPAPVQRLVSLDALRGFDMCWILGLSGLVEEALKRWNPPWKDAIVDQLDHVEWEGFHFFDLIFPLFLFIAGVSLSISLPRHVARQGALRTGGRLIWRAALLFLLGVIYSGGISKGLDNVRWLGVLQRIALGSMGAGLLSLWLSPRALMVALVTLLVGYWALLTFVPVPGIGAGHYAEGENLTNYLDQTYLPGRKYNGDHDPEGLLSTLPAIATALLGIFAGRWIQGSASGPRKVLGLIVAGVVLLAAGWAWGFQFPIVKNLWTSSFVLVAGGWSALLLGAFYGIVEEWKWTFWTPPFVWVGANPITLYLFAELGYFRIFSERLTGTMRGEWSWVPSLVTFLLVLLFARYLYKRGIFLRV